MGVTLRELIEVHGGGLASGNAVKAVLPGGPSSGFLTADDLDVPMDREPLIERGSALGCGVLRIVEDDQCIVEVADEIAQFFARESCRQCAQCQMETSLFGRILNGVVNGTATAQMLEQIPKVGAFSKGKGFCSLISMPVPPLTTAIRNFPDDFAAYDWATNATRFDWTCTVGGKVVVKGKFLLATTDEIESEEKRAPKRGRKGR